jgi:hypothetical protein
LVGEPRRSDRYEIPHFSQRRQILSSPATGFDDDVSEEMPEGALTAIVEPRSGVNELARPYHREQLNDAYDTTTAGVVTALRGALVCR